METMKSSPDALAFVESVLSTVELSRRPSRSPDYQAENQALIALTQELVNSPGGILQKLVDTALELCRAHSAGISLLENVAPEFRQFVKEQDPITERIDRPVFGADGLASKATLVSTSDAGFFIPFRNQLEARSVQSCAKCGSIAIDRLRSVCECPTGESTAYSG
jgi:hypothetical protein